MVLFFYWNFQKLLFILNRFILFLFNMRKFSKTNKWKTIEIIGTSLDHDHMWKAVNWLDQFGLNKRVPLGFLLAFFVKIVLFVFKKLLFYEIICSNYLMMCEILIMSCELTENVQFLHNFFNNVELILCDGWKF